MSDDVDAFVAGLATDGLDEHCEPTRDASNVVGERRVVQRDDTTKSTAAEAATQHGEDRVIVDDAVHHDDGRSGGLNVADDETALDGRKTLGCGVGLRRERSSTTPIGYSAMCVASQATSMATPLSPAG